jgi:hypothetical protein
VAKTETDIYQKEFGGLIGKTIKSVRAMTANEVQDMGWEFGYHEAFVIVCTDGTAIIPSQDPEGNGPGFLFLGEMVNAK